MNKKNTRQKENKGITLIALVITIIVMLILVAVTISMAVNGGLFDQAGKAAGQTKNALSNEQKLAEGGGEVDGEWYESIDEYLASKQPIPNYEVAKKDANGYLTEKATYSDGVEEKPAVIPSGFRIVNYGEKIANGIVISDMIGNEYVWIPVEKAILTEAEIAKIKEDNDSLTTDYHAVKKVVDEGVLPMAVQRR